VVFELQRKICSCLDIIWFLFLLLFFSYTVYFHSLSLALSHFNFFNLFLINETSLDISFESKCSLSYVHSL